LRERLAFIQEWRLRHHRVDAPPELATMDSLEALEHWLDEPIPPGDVLHKCPELDDAIRREFVQIFEDWTHDTWKAVDIALPADQPLLAVNADANAGIVADDGRWHVVDFAS